MKYATLWKRILNEGCLYDLPDGRKEAILHSVLCSPIIVDSRTGPADRMLQWGDYNRMEFPFDQMWIEGHVDDGRPWGCLLISARKADGSRDVGGWGFVGGGAGPACVGTCVMGVDGQGNLVGNKGDRMGTYAALSAHMQAQYEKDLVFQTLMSTTGMAFDVLTLLGCKNVTLEPRENDPKQTRRAIKRYGQNANSYRYHVLVVRPAGAKADSPSQEIGVMPRHVCRGHFAEYGPEFNKGLLFGRYAGRFFIPPHLKGKKENGVVEKDYAIAGSNQ